MTLFEFFQVGLAVIGVVFLPVFSFTMARLIKSLDKVITQVEVLNTLVVALQKDVQSAMKMEARIEKLEIENRGFHDRDHWFANKLGVLKGFMEIKHDMEFKDDWTLPPCR